MAFRAHVYILNETRLFDRNAFDKEHKALKETSVSICQCKWTCSEPKAIQSVGRIGYHQSRLDINAPGPTQRTDIGKLDWFYRQQRWGASGSLPIHHILTVSEIQLDQWLVPSAVSDTLTNSSRVQDVIPLPIHRENCSFPGQHDSSLRIYVPFVHDISLTTPNP